MNRAKSLPESDYYAANINEKKVVKSNGQNDNINLPKLVSR